MYAGDHDLTDPYLSPLFGDFTPPFPPTFLQTGTRDLFLSNTVRMHRRLREAGVEAELHVFEAMPHGGFFGAPEDEELAAEVRRFLASTWRTPSRPSTTGTASLTSDASLTTRGRRQDVDDVGADPAHADGAAPVAGGVEPVRDARIAVGDHEADAAVGLELRRVAVQRGLVVDVVERLHPVVVEGDHPVLARRAA